MGDQLDRGDQEVELLFWLERVQREAARAGTAGGRGGWAVARDFAAVPYPPPMLHSTSGYPAHELHRHEAHRG